MMVSRALQNAICISFLALNTSVALAEKPAHQDHHRHQAHVHGTWELFAALDGNLLSVNFEGPIVDLLGFEHPPEDELQLSAVENLKSRLNEPIAFVALSRRAGCTISESAEIAFPKNFVDARYHESNQDEYDDLGDHEEDEGHKDHDNHEDPDLHASNLEIRYVFNCKAPSKLTEIDVSGFDIFTAIKNIDAVFLSDKKQTADRLHAKKRTLKIN